MSHVEIRQRFLVAQFAGDPFEHHDFTATVWRDGATVQCPCPEGYVPGLFVGYVDGIQVTLPLLDAALASVGTTRAAVVAAIRQGCAA